MRAQRLILLRERDPFAVGRDRHGSDPAERARRQDARLPVADGVAVQLLVGRGIEQRLRVGRPDERAFLVVEIRDLLRRPAFRIGHPDLVAARSIRHERDELAVGRPLRLAAARRHGVGHDPRDVAAIGRDRQDLPSRRDHGTSSGRRDVERIDLVRHGFHLGFVVLVVGRDVQLDLVRLAAGNVELPDPEVVFVDDDLAVGGHRRPEHVAVGVLRDLHGLPRAARRNLVNVVERLADLRAARLDARVVRQRIGDVVDRIVGAPHRPQAVVAIVAKQLRVGVVRQVADPQIRRVAAAIVLARPDGRMAVEHDRVAVGREAARVAPVDRQRCFHPADHRDFIEHRDRRKRAVAARRAEDDVLAVARPADDFVVAGVIRQPLRRAAGGRDDEHVVVAVAVRREGDPLAVG